MPSAGELPGDGVGCRGCSGPMLHGDFEASEPRGSGAALIFGSQVGQGILVEMFLF